MVVKSNYSDSEHFCFTDRYYAIHLGEEPDHAEIISDFSTKPSNGVEDYLKYSAFFEEKEGLARTYLVRDKATKELVGYFSLRVGSIIQPCGLSFHTYSVPGIELENLGVNQGYRNMHPEIKKLGKRIIRYFAYPIAKEIAVIAGAKIFYIFAVPEDTLISYYEKLGFQHETAINRFFINWHSRPSYDKDCLFMYCTFANNKFN